MLACTGAGSLSEVDADRPDVEVLSGDLSRALEGSDREQLAQALDQALPELGRSADLDALVLRGTLVNGDSTRMAQLQRSRGAIGLDFDHPVVEQIVYRARRQEADWGDLEEAIQDCELLDQRPTRGLQPIEGLVSDSLAEVAHRLGGTRVALGRPERRSDPDPMTGNGDLRCRGLRLLDGDGLPERLPRSLHMAITDGTHRVYLSIRNEAGEPQAFVSNSARDAERLLGASLWWDTEGESRRTELGSLFGEGIRAP